MAFAYTNSKGKTYFLHGKIVKRANGTEGRLFYFASEVKPENALDAVPDGYKVEEMKTGLPTLKKAV